MSRFALAAALSLCASIVAAPRIANSQTSKDTSLKRETLADNVYLFRAPSDLDMWTATNVVVVINDRGPFTGGHDIDLSRRAAEKLGIIEEGVAKVRITASKAQLERRLGRPDAG